VERRSKALMSLVGPISRRAPSKAGGKPHESPLAERRS
jgi:hypothetical protein